MVGFWCGPFLGLQRPVSSQSKGGEREISRVSYIRVQSPSRGLYPHDLPADTITLRVKMSIHELWGYINISLQ